MGFILHLLFTTGCVFPGKSCNVIDQTMNSDSVILCLWIDFTTSLETITGDFVQRIVQELVPYGLNDSVLYVLSQYDCSYAMLFHMQFMLLVYWCM